LKEKKEGNTFTKKKALWSEEGTARTSLGSREKEDKIKEIKKNDAAREEGGGNRDEREGGQKGVNCFLAGLEGGEIQLILSEREGLLKGRGGRVPALSKKGRKGAGRERSGVKKTRKKRETNSRNLLRTLLYIQKKHYKKSKKKGEGGGGKGERVISIAKPGIA